MASPEGGFNPTWQRHVAAYALAGRFLPDGPGARPRLRRRSQLPPARAAETIGVDIDPGALEGQERETVVADMRDLPFDDGEFPSVLSVQSLEHVPDPERVLAEVGRVLVPDGTAVFVTPNRLTLGRPDEIIDPVPLHRVRRRGARERSASAGSTEVEIRGLFGSPAYMEIFDEERATLDRTLAKDPLRLRRLVPMRAKQWLYDTMLRRHRRDDDPRAAAITPERLRAARDRPRRGARRRRDLPLPPLSSSSAGDDLRLVRRGPRRGARD